MKKAKGKNMSAISIKVMFWLLFNDVSLFLKDFINNVIDAICWPITNIILSEYIMPAMGMSPTYGAFMVGGTIVIMSAYLSFLESCLIVADLDGNRSILYELTLPLPAWMVYCKYALSIAIRVMLSNVIALPLFKIILGNNLNLNNFSLIKFTIIYGLFNLFFGFFAVWYALFANTVKKHGRIWIRIVSSLFWVCCFQISWQAMNRISPIIGKITLFSPWTYAYEGSRVATIGQVGFISFWICTTMLTFFTITFALHGLWLFRKRLDCII